MLCNHVEWLQLSARACNSYRCCQCGWFWLFVFLNSINIERKESTKCLQTHFAYKIYSVRSFKLIIMSLKCIKCSLPVHFRHPKYDKTSYTSPSLFLQIFPRRCLNVDMSPKESRLHHKKNYNRKVIFFLARHTTCKLCRTLSTPLGI